MGVIALALLGLALGSFVNALVYRLHEQSKEPKAESRKPKAKNYKKIQNLSIIKGRSMCVYCGHILGWQDLIPIFSWLTLKGKCRYCGKPISPQYPLVETLTAVLFVLSYIYWPLSLTGEGLLRFIIWLPILTLLIALFVYDLRWKLLPDRLTFIVLGLAILQIVISLLVYDASLSTVPDSMLGLLCLGGLFYVLFQVSKGSWIGGGDVKLGFGLGLLAGNAPRALLILFLSAAIGSAVSIALISAHKTSRKAQVPYGPFLVVAAVIVQLFGQALTDWYQTQFLLI